MHMRMHTHTRAHARTHAHTHTHTQHVCIYVVCIAVGWPVVVAIRRQLVVKMTQVMILPKVHMILLLMLAGIEAQRKKYFVVVTSDALIHII